jgi:tetratricopeptide (TPR) repeat protein/superfamily II DNA or RNA helicase
MTINTNINIDSLFPFLPSADEEDDIDCDPLQTLSDSIIAHTRPPLLCIQEPQEQTLFSDTSYTTNREEIPIAYKTLQENDSTSHRSSSSTSTSIPTTLNSMLLEVNKAISSNTINATELARRGDIYRQQGKYAEALADLNKAILLNPNDTFALATRGHIYRERGKFKEALADLTQAIRLNPNDTFALATRGDTYRLQEKFKEALVDLNKATRFDPNDAFALIARGDVYRLQKKFKEALADLTQAIRLNPNDTFALIARGDVYAEQSKFKEALVDLNEAIRLQPNYSFALAVRGDIYRKQDKFTEALVDLDQAIRLAPNDAFALIARGDVYVEQSKLKEALVDLNKAIRLRPNNAYALAVRGDIYRQQSKFTEALADITQAIRLNPNNTSALVTRGYLYREQGKLPEFDHELNVLSRIEEPETSSSSSSSTPSFTSSSAAPNITPFHIETEHFAKNPTIVARYFEKKFIGKSRNISPIGRREEVDCRRYQFSKLKFKGEGRMPEGTNRKIYTGDGWNIEHYTSTPSKSYDRLSFVHLGRGQNGYMPKKPDGEGSRVIAVLSHHQKDMTTAFVEEGYDVLVVNEMDSSPDKCNFLIPRRLASLFFSEKVGAKDLIFLDDNIQDIFLSDEIRDDEPNWETIYDLYRQASKDTGLTLLSTESIGGHQKELPIAKDLIVREGAYGAKLTYVNLVKLREKKTPLRQLFPSELNFCLENHFLHSSIRALGLKSGAISRKSIVLQRNGENPGSCSSVEQPAEQYLRTIPPEGWNDFHKQAFTTIQQDIQAEMRRHERTHEREISRDPFNMTTPATSSDSSSGEKDLSREYEKKDQQRTAPATQPSGASSSLSTHNSEWRTEVAERLNQIIESMPREEQLREPQREALQKLCLMHQHQAKKGYIELPTGVGKTRIITSSVVAAMRSPSLQKTILVISPTRDLTKQMRDDLIKEQRLFGTKFPVVQVDSSTNSSSISLSKYKENKILKEHPKHIVVMCAKTAYEFLHQGGDPGFVIIDELHKISDKIYPLINGSCPLLGLSATPGDRAVHFQDENSTFGSQLYTYPVRKAVEKGYLCPWVTRSVTVQGPDIKNREWVKLIPQLLKQINHPEGGKVSDHPNIIYSRFTKEANSIVEDQENALAYHSYKIYRDEILDSFADDDKAENSIAAVNGLVEGSNFPKLRTVVVTNNRSENATRQILGRCLRLDSAAPNKKALLLLFDTNVTQTQDFPDSLICPESLSGITSDFENKKYTLEGYTFTISDKISDIFQSSQTSSRRPSPPRSPTHLSPEQLQENGISLHPLGRRTIQTQKAPTQTQSIARPKPITRRGEFRKPRFSKKAREKLQAISQRPATATQRAAIKPPLPIPFAQRDKRVTTQAIRKEKRTSKAVEARKSPPILTRKTTAPRDAIKASHQTASVQKDKRVATQAIRKEKRTTKAVEARKLPTLPILARKTTAPRDAIKASHQTASIQKDKREATQAIRKEKRTSKAVEARKPIPLSVRNT